MTPLKEAVRQAPLPLDSFRAITIDIETGRRELRNLRRRRREESVTDYVRLRALDDWWNRIGEVAFMTAAQTLEVALPVRLAEISGQNAEFFSAEMTAVHGEAILKKAYKATLFKPIRILDLAARLNKQARHIQNQSGMRPGWVNSFLSKAFDILAEERRLGDDLRNALQAMAH